MLLVINQFNCLHVLLLLYCQIIFITTGHVTIADIPITQSMDNNNNSFNSTVKIVQRSGKPPYEYKIISMEDLPRTFFYTTIRYLVSAFPPVTTVLGRNVTCIQSPDTKNEVYFEPTWACDDLKVDGLRLPYTNTIDRVHRLFGDNETSCGSYYRQHNMLDFCHAMLTALGLKQVSVPYVSVNKVSCEIVEKGLLYVKSAVKEGHYYWSEHKRSSGVALSIRCGLALQLA